MVVTWWIVAFSAVTLIEADSSERKMINNWVRFSLGEAHIVYLKCLANDTTCRNPIHELVSLLLSLTVLRGK